MAQKYTWMLSALGFSPPASGQILTNHHVAEPWWQNDDLKEMLDQGLEPMVAEMTAYFPARSTWHCHQY